MHLSNESQLAEVTAMINRILENNGNPVAFAETELKELLVAAKHLFSEQPILL